MWQLREEERNRIWVNDARVSYPNDVTCHFCNGDNDFADDCGWFYIIDPRELENRDERGHLRMTMYPACKSCHDKHSWKHIQNYGLGER